MIISNHGVGSSFKGNKIDISSLHVNCIALDIIKSLDRLLSHSIDFDPESLDWLQSHSIDPIYPKKLCCLIDLIFDWLTSLPKSLDRP